MDRQRGTGKKHPWENGSSRSWVGKAVPINRCGKNQQGGGPSQKKITQQASTVDEHGIKLA